MSQLSFKNLILCTILIKSLEQILTFTIGAEFIIVMPTSWAITSVMSQPCCPTSHSSSVLVAMHDVERKLNFGSVLKLKPH